MRTIRKPVSLGAAAAPRRFVSYLRVSTDKQGRSGLGIEAQRQAVAAFLAGENGSGAELLAEYVEVESGRRSDRPELAKALEHARLAGAILLIARLDRLSRNLHFLSGLQEAGVEFRACDIPSASRMVLSIMAAVAEEEARLIGERTRAALGEARKRIATTGQRKRPNVRRLGNPDGARAFGPDGPARGTVSGLATIRENADKFAQCLRPILCELEARGVGSANGMARALNERGVLSPRGGRWTAQTVLRVRERIDLVGAQR
jgi:DNA invertase Pin-like site-specific DNA recombinase